jgi:hypothetical protein
VIVLRWTKPIVMGVWSEGRGGLESHELLKRDDRWRNLASKCCRYFSSDFYRTALIWNSITQSIGTHIISTPSHFASNAPAKVADISLDLKSVFNSATYARSAAANTHPSISWPQ